MEKFSNYTNMFIVLHYFKYICGAFQTSECLILLATIALKAIPRFVPTVNQNVSKEFHFII